MGSEYPADMDRRKQSQIKLQALVQTRTETLSLLTDLANRRPFKPDPPIEDTLRRFCQALGNPDWSRVPEYTTVLSRKENEDQLDLLIGQWTQDQTAEEVTKKLQAVGVSAGPMLKASDLMPDPQLKHRNSFITLEHPEIGPHTYRPNAFKLTKTPEKIERPAPCLGEHNEYILQEILGMSDDEIANLVISGALE